MRARDAERAKFDAENAQLAAEALRDRCVWPTLRLSTWASKQGTSLSQYLYFCTSKARKLLCVADAEALRQQVA